MSETGTHRPSMVAGLAAFGVGALVLILVFVLAYGVYCSALSGIKEDGSRLLELVRRGVQLGALLVMAYAGSLLCSRGIQLFAAARSSHE